MIVTWFIATLIGSVAFLLPLGAGYGLSEWRRLRASGARRPAVILCKRLAGPAARFARFRSGEGARAVDLVGASVWLEWYQRWGVHGAGMGRVVFQADSGARPTLLIETASPQALPTGPTSAVWFEPTSGHDLQRHRMAAVRGTLRDHGAPDRVAAQQGELTAKIVVVSRAG